MEFLLLFALACLVSAAEDPLLFSGKFKTIYLASKNMKITAENSQYRMLMREVKYFNQYKSMNMTFYIRKDRKCELHKVRADKLQKVYCTSDTRRFILTKCPPKNGTDLIPGLWSVRDVVHHFSNVYMHRTGGGGLHGIPSGFYILIHIASNTTILFETQFYGDNGVVQTIIGALATGTNITEEMHEEYIKLIKKTKIPTENIKNVYETDTCPKREP